MYLNTSADDLALVTAKTKVQIPGASGCNKDRKKALEYAKDYYNEIMRKYQSWFSTQDYIYFVFSMGGGTGSGLSPVLLDVMSKNFPDKHFGAVAVFPSMSEPLKAQVNAIECYLQLKKVELLKNIFILDNNNDDDFFEINRKFSDLFDTLVNVTRPDTRGIVDHAELELMLRTPGNTFMTELSISRVGGLMDGATDMHVSNYNLPIGCFTKYNRGCRYITTSTVNKIDPEKIHGYLGRPIDLFTGYSLNHDFVAAFGMPWPDSRLEELAMNKDLLLQDIEARQESNIWDTEIILPDLDLKSTSDSRSRSMIDQSAITNIFDQYK